MVPELPSCDPDWQRLMRDADVDDAWLEWEQRQDRLQDFTPSGGVGAAFKGLRKGECPRGSVQKGTASSASGCGLSHPVEVFSPVPRVGVSPSASGVLLTPPRTPDAPSSSDSEAA